MRDGAGRPIVAVTGMGVITSLGAGKAENWQKAEKTLLDLVKSRGMNYSAEEGEAAFYGPKIDFVVRNCIGREWQLGTVQLDYNMPLRFELTYTGATTPSTPR